MPLQPPVGSSGSGVVETYTAARRMSCGNGDAPAVVVVLPEAVPINCSEAATVLLDPSMIVAADWGRPRMNAPLAGRALLVGFPTSPTCPLPGSPLPVQK